MSNSIKSCAKCSVIACRNAETDKYPPFCPTQSLDSALLKQSLDIYESNTVTRSLALCSAAIEAEFYCKMSRVEETLEFIKRQNYGLVGVATCVGLLHETRIFCSLLEERKIPHIAVSCKMGAIAKRTIGLSQEQQVNGTCEHESMCNPVLQALYLNSRETNFNVMIGLCVGHDSMFLQHIIAPTTVLIVKDRVLAHNPAAALYTIKSYYKRLNSSKIMNKK
ncbi:MAG: DUF1847 domain-containing protein [Desulfomicrobium sp.]|nr:DUF1847 domain-containing protein [Desulfomicrobium sp.]